MPETVWMNPEEAAPLREGQARTINPFGTPMPGRIALGRKTAIHHERMTTAGASAFTEDEPELLRNLLSDATQVPSRQTSGNDAGAMTRD